MRKASYLVVCLNPTFQKTLLLQKLQINEVNRSQEYYLTLAGKGMNTARVLMQLGCQVKHLTHLGGSQKDLFLTMVNKDGIPLLWIDSGSEIRTCTTLVDIENHTTTEIVEEPERVREETQNQIIAAYEGAMPHFDAVIIAGTSAPGYDEETLPRMVKSAREMDKLIILDIKGNDLRNSLPFSPSIIKPNFSEFLKTFKPHAEQGEHAIAAEEHKFVTEQMLEIYKTYKTTAVITSGANPTLFVENGSIASLPVHPITPVNTIGSGDAFTAGLAAAVGAGSTIAEAVRNGQKCGAKNAELIIPGTII
jgi:fructose-1-phosphate kinase PfkB-like protein